MPNIAATLSLNVPAITALCKGAPGSSLLNGVGAPSSLSGNNGDFYLDTSLYNMYGPKANGAWNNPTALSNSILQSVWNSTNTTVYNLSGSWNSVYTTVNSTSGTWLSGSAISNSVYNTVNGLSANDLSVYSTVSANSASWSTGSTLASSVYTTVSLNSATWNAGGGGGGNPSVNSVVIASSGNWNSSYNSITSLSASWTAAYSTVYSASGGWSAASDTTQTVIYPYSGNWQSSYAFTNAINNQYYSLYSSVSSLSGLWQFGYSQTLTANPNIYNFINNFRTSIAPSSAQWNNVTTTYMFFDSALNVSNYNTVNSLSAGWQGTTLAAQALVSFVSTLSTLTAVVAYVQANSANTQFNNLSAYALSASYLAVDRGAVITGQYTGPYSDGTVVDYQTGNGRILVGPSDNLSFYSNYSTGGTPTINATLFYTGGLSARGGLSGTDININPAPSLPTSKTVQNKYLPINVGGTIYYLSLYQ